MCHLIVLNTRAHSSAALNAAIRIQSARRRVAWVAGRNWRRRALLLQTAGEWIAGETGATAADWVVGVNGTNGLYTARSRAGVQTLLS